MPTSLLDIVLKLVLSLGIVLGGIALVAAYAKRRGIPGLTGLQAGGRSPSARRDGITVLARQQLGKGIALVAVRAGEVSLLLGVTPNSVTPLAELDPDTFNARDDLRGVHELTSFPGPVLPDGVLPHGVLPDGVLPHGTLVDNGQWARGITARPQGTGRTPAVPAASTWTSKLDQLRDLTTRRS